MEEMIKLKWSVCSENILGNLDKCDYSYHFVVNFYSIKSQIFWYLFLDGWGNL